MKRIIFIAFILSGFLSCDDILEEELTGDLTADGVFTDEEGIDFALNGAYASLGIFIGNSSEVRAGTNRETGWTLLTLGTDTYTAAADTGFEAFDQYTPDLNASSPVITEPWDEFYRGINAANGVISRAPDALSNNPEKLQNVLGQARFLRGYFYFWLARIYGPVHYTDEETIGAQTEATRMPLDELYPRIIEDLEFAEQNLPGEQSDFGRATSWVAKTTLADLYLTRKNYDLAAQYSEDVIENGPFSLVRPFADLWDLGNQQNSEIIFSFQFDNNLEFNNGGNPAHMFFLSEYDRQPGMLRDIENGRPWKRFRPTEYLLQLYDDDDERYEGTFKSAWFANNPDNLPAGMQLGDTAIFTPKPPYVSNDFADKPYKVPADTIFDRLVYPATKKWIQPDRISIQEVSGSRDFVAYRLAEVYLMASEANALKAAPDQGKALRYLNEVRLRAYGVDDVAELPLIASVDIDVILEERAKELAQEGKRWFDLVRTDLLVERVRMFNPGRPQNIQEFHTLRPIPLTQIDRTSTDFPQNPGY